MDKTALDIVNEFTKLQRASVIAEIMYSKGQIEMMQKALSELVLSANKVNGLINGGNNVRREEESYEQTNTGRGKDPAE